MHRLALLGLLIAAQSAGAQSRDITSADLRRHVFALADDSMGGRPTGSPGHEKATEYVAAHLQRLGLQPAGENGTWFQTVPAIWRRIEFALAMGRDSAVAVRDYRVFSTTVDVPRFSGQVIVGGLTGDTTTWISAEQARGRMVLLIESPGSLGLSTSQAHNPRFRDAFIVAHAGFGSAYRILAAGSTPNPVFRSPTDPAPAPRPITLIISEALAERLMGRPFAELRAGLLGGTVEGRASIVTRELVSRNVVALLPGADPARRGQYVALGAHIDHDPPQAPVDHDSLREFNRQLRALRLRLNRPPSRDERNTIIVNVDSLRRLRPPRLDSIRNGADDDASGTASVLEIAEALARAARRPARSVLFIWHVGEEQGMRGSAWFMSHPTVPRDSIVAQLNVDMAGRGGPGEEIGGGPDYLQLIGWRRLSNELGDVIEAANRSQPRPFTFDLQYDANGHPQNFYCRSDHASYARYGIPVAFFTTGSHGDYHQVTDEPQYLDYDKLTAVTRLIHDVAVRLANAERRPAVDGPVPDPAAPCRQ